MSNKLLYPYKWGKTIVNKLCESQDRGTRNFAEIVGISTYDLRHFLTLVICSGNSVKWESIKLLIKGLGDYERGDLSSLSLKEKKELYKCLRKIYDDKALDRLIARDAIDTLNQHRLF